MTHDEMHAIAEAATPGELRPEWLVADAYVGVAAKELEATDEDGNPIWTVPIECSNGYAQVADVCGGSAREAVARAHAICRALKGGSVSHDEFHQIKRLYASDREQDWIAAEFITCLAGAHVGRAALIADLAAKDARLAVMREALERMIGLLRATDDLQANGFADDAVNLARAALADQPTGDGG